MQLQLNAPRRANAGKIIFVALVIILGLGISALLLFMPEAEGTNEGPPQSPAPVLISRVSSERIEDSLEALGTVRANEHAVLTAKVTEQVVSVNFDDGEYVSQGRLLIQLNSQEQRAALAEAEAQLDERKRQLARVREVESSGALSRSAIDEEETRFTIAQARIDSIQSQLNDRQIRAPFDGLLGLRNVSPGELVTPSKELVTISDLTPVKVDFTIPERYIGAIREGQSIEATTVSYPDRVFAGDITSISPIVDPVSRAAQARAIIENEETLLRPGMLLQVNISLGLRTRLTIPESALKPVGNRTYVMRLDEGNVAHEIEIQVGERYVGKVEVTDGLQAEDRIITHGFRANPGQQVEVKSEDEVFTAALSES